MVPESGNVKDQILDFLEKGDAIAILPPPLPDRIRWFAIHTNTLGGSGSIACLS